jgi:hypothetical protein
MLLLNDVDVKSLSNEIAVIVNSNDLKSCEVDVSPRMIGVYIGIKGYIRGKMPG